MASSEKTAKLGLSLWTASDKPERLDFVQDNQKLEELVGTHIADMSAHLTESEKQLLSNPYTIYVHRGTGAASYTINSLPGGKDPKLILAMCQEFPPCTVDANGKLNVYWDFWMHANKFANYGGGGISVDLTNKTLTMKNQVSAPGNWYSCTRNLNENGKIYVLIFFYDAA